MLFTSARARSAPLAFARAATRPADDSLVDPLTTPVAPAAPIQRMGFAPTQGAHNGLRITDTITREIVDGGGGDSAKVYTVVVSVNGVRAGHVKLLTDAIVGCFSTSGTKNAPIRFDDITVVDAFRGSGINYAILWAAATHALGKGYTHGIVNSISTVASFQTFTSAGFAGIAGAGAPSIAKVAALNTFRAGGANPNYQPDEALYAGSAGTPLAAIQAACAARVQRHTGVAPA